MARGKIDYSNVISGKLRGYPHHFSSKAEAAWFLWLLYLQSKGKVIRFEYEPVIYAFKGGKKVKGYKPDFQTWLLGEKGYVIQEIKGRMSQADTVKMRLMKIQYPNIKIEIIFTKSDEYQKAYSFVRMQLKQLFYECGNKRIGG